MPIFTVRLYSDRMETFEALRPPAALQIRPCGTVHTPAVYTRSLRSAQRPAVSLLHKAHEKQPSVLMREPEVVRLALRGSCCRAR
ncbi:hypothetical protein EXN66_Car016850 [Channa argus]|uniref:Uncharacterized protein n=1 Tax=Channa argus TaxID=215402 RepID=A0A6G1QF30_CHAAH|nr:hypothetical protein EXN66_Car016850 [Channa argus]